MGEKRFRTRRQWHNTALTVLAAPFVVLTGVVFGVVTGKFILLVLLGGFFTVVLVIAFLRDHSSRAAYHITQDSIALLRGSDRLDIQPEEVLDASLVDRIAARDYIRLRKAAHRGDRNRAAAIEREFLRFCTVDIGMRSYTLGLGRGVIDRMPNAKHDLVLLRMRKGSDLLLSPEYNQEMMDAIVKLLRRSDEVSAARKAQL